MLMNIIPFNNNISNYKNKVVFVSNQCPHDGLTTDWVQHLLAEDEV